MTKELLTEFIHQDLGSSIIVTCGEYRPEVVVDDFKVYIDRIHLYDTRRSIGGFGHVFNISRYQNWLSSRRQDKIKKILE